MYRSTIEIISKPLHSITGTCEWLSRRNLQCTARTLACIKYFIRLQEWLFYYL